MKKATSYTVQELCRLFNVSVSTYYYQASEKPADIEKQEIIDAIKDVAVEHGHTYGKRRMQPALQKKGFELGLFKISTLMKQSNVVAIVPKKKHYYANTGEVHKKSPNLLNRQFDQETALTHWVGDITYCRTHQGWSYLACVLDLGTKEVVGWSMSKSPNAQLAKDALRNAIQKHRPGVFQASCPFFHATSFGFCLVSDKSFGGLSQTSLT